MTRLKSDNEDIVSDFGFGPDEISMINQLNVPATFRRAEKHLEKSLDFSMTDGLAVDQIINVSNHKNNSNGKKQTSNLTLKKSFDEDRLLENQKTKRSGKLLDESERPTIKEVSRPSQKLKAQPSKNLSRGNRTFKPRHELINSNDESEVSCREDLRDMSLLRNSHILDDTFFESAVSTKMKMQYLNILIVGESKLGKFNFIQFCFEQIFNKKIIEGQTDDKINEYVHEISNKKVRKVITLAHAYGYSAKHPIKEWYKGVKSYLKRKMLTYEEIRELFMKDKKLQKQQVIDSRVHLCLFFVKAPKIRLNEIIYMKKLQKYVNVIPVIVEKTSRQGMEYEMVKTLKLNMKHELHNYDIETFDFIETDFALKQLRDGLVAKTTPFFLTVTGDQIDKNEHFSDLNTLLHMLVMPYVTPFLYKTEILYNNVIRKVLNEKRKRVQENKETDNSVGIGFGVAIGLGFVGALVAFKNKFF